MNMQNIMQYVGVAIAALGAMAFVVSVIVEVIKGVELFKKIPTDIVVLVLSIVLTVLAFACVGAYMAFIVVWYMWVAATVAGFMVAFLAMYGWGKWNELWNKFKTPKTNEDVKEG